MTNHVSSYINIFYIKIIVSIYKLAYETLIGLGQSVMVLGPSQVYCTSILQKYFFFVNNFAI